MRGTFEGQICGVVRREDSSKPNGNGGRTAIPAAWFLLLITGWDSYPTRVRLSDAQASELNNPALQFERIQIVGEVVYDNGQVIDCASYSPVTTSAAKA